MSIGNANQFKNPYNLGGSEIFLAPYIDILSLCNCNMWSTFHFFILFFLIFKWYCTLLVSIHVCWQTPLHCAIIDLKLDIFKLLLSHGADFTRLDGTGLTPIALAENMELDEYVEEMEEEQGNKMTKPSTSEVILYRDNISTWRTVIDRLCNCWGSLGCFIHQIMVSCIVWAVCDVLKYLFIF